MTECNTSPLAFSSLGQGRVRRLLRRRLTTDAGALLLREVDRRLGLFDALDAAIPDPRDPDLHRPRPAAPCSPSGSSPSPWATRTSTTIRPCAPTPRCKLAAGTAPDAEPPLASPPTLCRLENRVDRAALVRIAEVLVDQFIAAHAEPPEHLILDFDATDDPIHGQQEGRFFHGYYDQLLLPAAVRLLRRRAAGGLPAAQRHRRRQAQPAPS